jgi:predicted Rossmann fold flavoprotein
MNMKSRSNSSKTKVIVIGGGPAGLMAAGQAALTGAQVTLIEKKDTPARKLRLTGNGRCNLTNTLSLENFLAHFGRNGKFLRPAFSRFFTAELKRFFEQLGIKLITDDRGRIYPKSNDANDIADAMLDWNTKCGVKIVSGTPVIKVISKGDRVAGIQIDSKKEIIAADIVIIATGGASYPSTGSSGDGYRLAESLGHTIVPIRPASVPLVTSAEIAPKLQGISLESINIKVKIEGKTSLAACGYLLFTHFGVSGPVILSISRYCVDQLRKGAMPILSIDLMPVQSENELDQLLIREIEKQGKSQILTILKIILPQKMAPIFLCSIGIELTKPCNQLSSSERRKIGRTLKNFQLSVVGHRSMAEAMVTAGGVNLKEVNPQSLESILIKGLYFAGEVLDLDADTGGFNLQAAFSTGWLAGQLGKSS